MSKSIDSFDSDRSPLTDANHPLAASRPNEVARYVATPFVEKLVATASFRRLQDISFLGAIDYVSQARHGPSHVRSRFAHSLAVAALVQRAAERIALSDDERNLALAAALLHDVGHGPLSHSLERDFETEFGINHHRTTHALIVGSGSHGADVRRVLAESGIDQYEVLALIEGKSTHRFNAMFGGPINFDTIEGIHRALAYERKSINAITAAQVVDAAVRVLYDSSCEGDIRILDTFWNLKDLIYKQFVRGALGVESDYKCHLFFNSRKHLFTPAIFDGNEKSLKARFPDLFIWLKDGTTPSKVNLSLGESISYVHRDFSVNQDASDCDDPAHYLRGRYRQTKKDEIHYFSVLANIKKNGMHDGGFATY